MSKPYKPDALLLRVMSAIHKTAETPEPGYRTINEWCTKWGMERNRVKLYLVKALQLGLMDTKVFRRTIRKNTKPYPIVHYGEKSRPKKT